MKKLRLFTAILFIAAMSLALTAGDFVKSKSCNNKSQELVIAKRSKGKKLPQWGTAIGRCNVRSAPSSNASIVDEIYDGEAVFIMRQQGQWYYICYGPSTGATYGWTHKTNLRVHYTPAPFG